MIETQPPALTLSAGDRWSIEDIAPRLERNPETRRLEGEHATIVGITGWGKTYLVRRLARMRTYAVMHDPKGTFRDPAFVRVPTMTRLEKMGNSGKYPKLVYQPSRRELRDQSVIAYFFEWCYINQNRTVIIDEVTSVVKRQEMPDAYFDGLSRGRELGLEYWSLSQQPVNVPNLVFTQSRCFYVFFTSLDAHRKKIAEMLPVTMQQVRDLDKGEFYYYREGMRGAIGPMRLRDTT